MSFNPSSGGGGSIGGANDVALSNPASDNVLTYDGSTGKWRNQDSPVASVNSQTGNVVVDKAAIGLGSVDNTSDASKPISTAAQTALAAKAPLNNPTFTGSVVVPTATAASNPVTKAQLDAAVAAVPNVSIGATAPTDTSINVWFDTSSAFSANLITGDAATFDTSVPAIWQTANCTKLWVSTDGYPAVGSMQVTRSTVSSATMRYGVSATVGSAVAVTANANYVGSARVKRVGTTPLQITRFLVRWYDSSNVLIGSDIFGSDTNEVDNAWVQISLSVTAPSNAAWARPGVQVTSDGVTNGDVHLIDDVWFRRKY